MVLESAVFYPVRERKISFRGKEMVTADSKDGGGTVSNRSLCEAFSKDRPSQRKRLMRQQGFFAPSFTTFLLTTPGGPHSNRCLMSWSVSPFLLGSDFHQQFSRLEVVTGSMAHLTAIPLDQICPIVTTQPPLLQFRTTVMRIA